MLKRLILVLTCVFAGTSLMSAQAVSTARRGLDLQVGVGFTGVNSDYDPDTLKGFALYTTADITNHYGAEFVFHQANAPSNDKVYERTYEIGPRYHRTYGHFSPYAKVMYGRGVFNFPNDVANLAYNMFAAGVGVDVKILPRVNFRVDYEYQKWLSFPPSGLTPQAITIGVAYHFPSDLQRGRHF